MQQNTVIIYMILSAFSLIWIILCYYGYDRKMYLRFFSLESYAEKYQKLPRVQSKRKVIVSLSTSKKNLNDIKATMNSILDQTVHPDQIILSTQEQVQIPEYLKTNNILLLHSLAKDYDQIAPLVSPLLREKDADTQIIVLNVDNGNVYGKDLIQSLVEESEKNPNSIIYIKGYEGRKFADHGKKVDNPQTNDIVNINHGVLVKPKFFNADILTAKGTYAPNATLSAFATRVPLQKLEYKDSFIQKENSNDENEKMGAMFYASKLKSFK